MTGKITGALVGALAGVLFATAVVAGVSAGTSAVPTAIVADTTIHQTRVVMHFVPEHRAVIEDTYRDLIEALGDAHFLIVVDKADDFETFLCLFGGTHPDRFSSVVTGESITTWSRDRYTLAGPRAARLLFVPPQSPALFGARAGDYVVPFKLAAQEGAQVSVVDFDFDGGDLIASDTTVYVDANLIRKNRDKFRSNADVAEAITEVFGRSTFVLGEGPDDVPSHHIGMYLTPLPNGSVAVGSPTLAVELLGERGLADFRTSLAASSMPDVDLSPDNVRRFDGPAEQLAEHGLRVVRIPLLPLADRVTFVSYNNGVFDDPGEGGPPHFLMPVYGLSGLDTAAVSVMEAEGVEVVPIDVSKVYRYHGSVRCLINVM